MKAIIRWEQLNKKPFSQIDYTSEDEIISLFYVCDQSTGIKVSLAEFREGLKEEDAMRMVKNFERQISLAAQYQTISKKKEKEAKDAEDSNPIYIKKIVPMLVMNGLDVHFAMNEMELCDLPIFIQAYDQKMKDKLEAGRNWAFMQLLPHLKKGTTPKELYPFSWEMEEETISEEEMEKAKGEFATLLKTGLTI